MTKRWDELSSNKRRQMHNMAKGIVSGGIIEDAAARLIASLIVEAAAEGRERERGKWLDAIGEYFDGPTAEAVRAYAEDRGTRMEMKE